MDIREVTLNFAVAPQLQPGELAALAARGFVAIMCNRPDGEEPGQPDIAEMRDAAQSAGLAFHHIPVWGGEFPEAAISAFRAVRQGTRGKVLAYCRSGTRSITLETLANPDDVPPAERLERAAAAGYDLTGISGMLR